MGACTGRPRGWIEDPAKRHARAVKAGAASGRAAQARARERVKGLTPEEAFAQGDRVGYARAYHFWRRWARRTVEQLTGRTVAA